MKWIAAILVSALAFVVLYSETATGYDTSSTPSHSHFDDNAIPQRSAQEDWNSYKARLDAQKRSEAAIPARGTHEDWNSFKARLDAQRKTTAVILPRGAREDWNSFIARVDATKKWRPAK